MISQWILSTDTSGKYTHGAVTNVLSCVESQGPSKQCTFPGINKREEIKDYHWNSKQDPSTCPSMTVAARHVPRFSVILSRSCALSVFMVKSSHMCHFANVKWHNWSKNGSISYQLSEGDILHTAFLRYVQVWVLILSINILKPTGYVMHHQFNIQQLYALPT